MPAVRDELLDRTPAIRARYDELEAELWQRGGVSPTLLELCRLRIAHLVGDTAGHARRTPQALAAGLDDDVIAALPQWPTSPRFDQVQRAALSFAESFVIDAHSVTDAQCAELNRCLTPPELATLTTAVALFDAMSRFDVALGVSAPTTESA
jgi:alkylhydroperoxidase family enzyme